MEEETLLAQVAAAGRALTKEGLVARTWGNISARVDETTCYITPSGLGYEDMQPEDVVTLSLTEDTWEGIHKPSGERGVHVAAYQLFPEVCYVIHTHQTYGTALGLAGFATLEITEEEKAALGGIALAVYGMPGSRELIAAVRAAMETGAQTIFMAHHGMLICGVDEAQAFSRARLIEEICKRNAKGQADTPRKRLAEQGACLPCELDDMAMLIGRTLQAAELDLPDETLCPQDYETWGILIEKASICHLHTLALGVDAVLPEKEVAFLHEDYVNRYAKLKKSE